MEKKLKELFDYQKYAENKHLAKIIDETLNEGEELLEDVIGAVTGGVDYLEQDKKEEKDK